MPRQGQVGGEDDVGGFTGTWYFYKDFLSRLGCRIRHDYFKPYVKPTQSPL